MDAHDWSSWRWSTSQRWSTGVAEINAPRASRLRNLDLRYPEVHTDLRTTDDGWKSGSSALLVPEAA